MASGTISGGTYNSIYSYYMTWSSVSNGSSANTSNVTLNWIYKKNASDPYGAYNTGGSSKVTLTINGTSSGAMRADFDLRSASTGTAATIATFTLNNIPHNSDGTCTINVSGSHVPGNSWSTKTISSTSITLDTIPRYPTANAWIVSGSVTESSANVGWSSDSTIKQVYYSKDGGSNWIQVTSNANASSGTISGISLSVNSTTSIIVRLYRSDSGLYKDSSSFNITTYDYPKAQGMTNFTIGNGANINLYNPLSRSVNLYLLKTGETNTNNHIGKYTGTGSGIINAEFKTADAINRQYNSIPNSTSGTYYCKVVYGSSTKDYNDNNNHTYSIAYSDAEKPSFQASYVTAINTANTSITGTNTNKFIKGHNQLRVSINTQMTANKGSYRSYYTISGSGFNSVNKQSTDTLTNIDVGQINANSFNVTAFDTRGLNRQATISINLIDYSNPTNTSVDIKRENGIGTKAVVSFSGKYTNWSGLAQNNTITSIKYKVGSSGSWTSFPNATPTSSSGNWSISDTIQNVNNTDFVITSTYDIYIQVVDKLETVTFGPYQLGTADALLWRDLANKRLGIRTKPSYTLHVNGDIYTDAKYRIRKGDGYGIYNTDNKPIIRDHNNTNVTVDATGGTLYLGYQNTTGINILNGKATINSNGLYSGKANTAGTADSATTATTAGTANKVSTGSRNTTDTWVPIWKNGALDYTTRYMPGTKTHSQWQTEQDRLVTLNFMSFWNGAYDGNNNSNLTYCSGGAIANQGQLPTHGSNSNGHWIRFPNIKYQIVWFDGPSKKVRGNNYDDYWLDFPIAFSDVPCIITSLFSDSTSADMGYIFGGACSKYASGFTFRLFNRGSGERWPYLRYVAFGPYS